MKKRTLTKGMLMAALICGCVQWGGTAVHAAELQEFTLDPMVVTAQRMETRDLDTPAMTNVITAADIEKTGATTVMEALRYVPGFTDNSYSATGDDQGASRSRVLVRGFDKATLVMLNGAPINVMNYGSAAGIPVEAIERIEIVKGANSVLYGAEAMSGVINIITKKGVGDLKTTVSGTTGNYLKKWNTTLQGEGYVVSLGKDYVDRFSPSNRPNNNKGTGLEYSDNSKYQRDSAFASLALSPNLQLNWLYQKADPKTCIRDAVTNEFKRAYYEYTDTKNAINLIYDDKENKTKTTLAYNEVKMESMDIASPGSDLKVTTSTGMNYEASNLYLDTQKQWDLSNTDSLIAGITMKHEKYAQIYTDVVDNERNSYAIYASYNKKFNDKFSTSLGVRGQHYASTDYDNSYDEILPQLQTVYKLNENTSWYTNIGRAFELPAINAHEYYAIGGKLKNPVEPQSGWNYETGLKKVTDTTATKLAIYHMDFKNKFAWKKVPEIDPNNAVQVNTGEFRNTGVEVEYKKVLNDKWSYNLGAAYQNPESYDEGKNKWIQETARVTFNAGLDYKLDKLTTSLSCYYLGDREDAYYKYDGSKASGNADHKIEDKIKINASLSYKPTDYQAITFNMYNLLDRDDYVSSYERYDLPFNWTLTYTHTF